MLSFPEGTPIFSGDGIRPVFAHFAAKLRKALPIHFHTDAVLTQEEYKVTLAAPGAEIIGGSDRALFYGLQTLLDRVRENNWRDFSCHEVPVAPERVVKLYLPTPAPEAVAEFKKIIDFAARCKFNAVMLELGGALEYKSHPEINAGWIEYAAKMNEYPGKTLDIMNGFPWEKNSIHSENGGGKIVPQQLFLELVTYCRDRFMEVIPEMPSLSHSDYLLTRHRELAERQEDPYPDCCCPQDPRYHQLFQELLEEVIGLIHPQKINIGHDEYYSVALCPRCKGKDPAALYAADINRIGNFLRSRGITPLIWGDKLIDAAWRNGEPIGGAAAPSRNGKPATPALLPSRDLISCNPEIYHWYWNVDRNLEQSYIEHNWDFLLANFNPPIIKEWSRRIHAPHAKGVCVSNWGESSWRTLQRNGVLYNLMYASFLLWDPALGSEDYLALNQRVMKQLYLECAPLPSLSEKILTVTHTVKTDLKFKYFYDGFMLDEAHFLLGEHVFQSETTGKIYRFPVIFGTNISNTDATAIRRDDPDSLADAYSCDTQYREVSAETLPVFEGPTEAHPQQKPTMWYQCRYLIPADCCKLNYLRFEPSHELVPQVQLKSFQLKL